MFSIHTFHSLILLTKLFWHLKLFQEMYEALGNLTISKVDASCCVVNKITFARMTKVTVIEAQSIRMTHICKKKKEYLQQGSKYECIEDGHGMDYSKNSKEAGVAKTQRTGGWHDTRLERG